MKEFKWNSLKNERLKKVRGLSFEEVLKGEIVDTINHPARPEQKMSLVWFREYIWVVPYVENQEEVFLKTFYPSRKYTKLFKKGKLL